MACDAWGNLVVIKNDFIHYRNRALDIHAVNLIQAKGKRVFINHYRENNDLPKMLIMCSNTNSATGLYEYILEKMRVSESDVVYNKTYEDIMLFLNDSKFLLFNMATSLQNVKFPTLWTFLGCSRH